MRNFYEQKRNCNMFMLLVLVVILTAVAGVLFYGPLLLPTVAGYTQVNFLGDAVEKDDGTLVADKGDRLICKEIVWAKRDPEEDYEGHDEADQSEVVAGLEDKVIVFYDTEYDDEGEAETRTLKVGVFLDYDEHTEVNGIWAELCTEDGFYIIKRADIVGTVAVRLPKVGGISAFMTTTVGFVIGGGAGLFLLFVMIAFISAMVRMNKRLGTPGIKLRKLSPEDAFILANVTEFLKSMGLKLNDEPGLTVVYQEMGHGSGQYRIFGKIVYMSGSIYVIVNAPSDNSSYADRKNYIRIERAVKLDEARQRIRSAYSRCFN